MRGLSRTLVFSAAALALTAGDAHGQLGGIARRAAGRVVGGAAAQAAQPAAAPAAASRAPRFDDETLEITTDVVNRFVLALNTEATERQKLAAERAAAGSMRAEVERYERCTARAADQRQDQNAALSANDDQLAMRMTQAILRNDTAAYRRMTDSLVAAQARNSDSSVCGQRPNAAYQAIRRLDNADGIVAGAAADAGRFTVRQFAILRERIAPWVLSRGREGAFTPEERRALEGATGLAGREEQLRS